jgi:hypothetical protein
VTDVDIYPDWWNQAACVGTPADIFFPKVGPNDRRSGTDPYTDARAICANCPVRCQCLTYANELGIEHGMWGGQTPEQRNPSREPNHCDECGDYTRRPMYCSHACRQRAYRRRAGW